MDATIVVELWKQLKNLYHDSDFNRKIGVLTTSIRQIR